MNLKFDNITISGGVGVGTTTLMNNLKPHLEPLGWHFKSTGQFIREYTKENILPLSTLVSDDFNRKIEAETYKLLTTEKHWVIDSWLAGFITREVPTVLRVYLYCSEPSIIVDRIVNRDKVSVERAKELVRKRNEGNIANWKKIYGDYDFFDHKYYHLAIDTYSSGQLETVGKVLDKLGFQANKR